MKHISNVLVFLLITTVLMIGVLESVYRFQIIDTYNPELQAFNPDNILDDDESTTILALGDSFTAGNNSYPVTLRNNLDGYRVINSGISGTGINEALLIAPHRFLDFKPSIFIYQIYVGNDLMNIRYPVNWNTLSLQRNMYWTLIRYVRSLAYLNYRLSQVSDMNIHKNVKDSESSVEKYTHKNVKDSEFSVEKYTKRWRLYLQADPEILEDQITITDVYRSEYGYFLEQLNKLLAYCKPADCTAYVVVIPHASQVHSKYLGNQKDLGAHFSNPDAIGKTEYPFIMGIRSSLADNNNAIVLNPLKHLRNMENNGINMYYQNDPHLNPAGQEQIGIFLLERIRFESAHL